MSELRGRVTVLQRFTVYQVSSISGPTDAVPSQMGTRRSLGLASFAFTSPSLPLTSSRFNVSPISFNMLATAMSIPTTARPPAPCGQYRGPDVRRRVTTGDSCPGVEGEYLRTKSPGEARTGYRGTSDQYVAALFSLVRRRRWDPSKEDGQAVRTGEGVHLSLAAKWPVP